MNNTGYSSPQPDTGNTKHVWNQHDDYKSLILNNGNAQLIIPSLELFTTETKSHKQKNTFEELPNPSIELFEFIGKNDKFNESVEQSYFAELLVLLFPSVSNSSILFFQKNLNSLILSKDDFNFTNEYIITRSKEPLNLPQINASLGALHYFYLLYYEWLLSLKDIDNISDYEEQTMCFFEVYLKSTDIVLKYDLAKHLKYTSNLFFQKSKAQEIYTDILTIGHYLKEFFESHYKIHNNLFRTKLEEYETEYLKLVKKFILKGANEIGHKENYQITDLQIMNIVNSLLFENMSIQTNKGLWAHSNDISTFLNYIKRYHLLKHIHQKQDEKDQESDSGEQGSGNSGKKDGRKKL